MLSYSDDRRNANQIIGTNNVFRITLKVLKK